MAIVKMKHLRLMALQEDRDALLLALQRMGCVEIGEPSVEDLDGLELARPDTGELTRVREANTVAQRAMGILKQYTPEKGMLLRPRPFVTEGELFDEVATAKALEVAQQIVDTERQIVARRTEESKINAQLLSLKPWLGLDIPLETVSSNQLSFHMGMASGNIPMEEIERAVMAVSDLAQLTEVYSDREYHYLLLVCHQSVDEAIVEALKPYNWTRSNLRGITGTAVENTRQLEARIQAIAKENQSAKDEIIALAVHRDALRRLLDRTKQEIARAEVRGRSLDTQTAFYIKGWIPAERCAALDALLKDYVCAVETRDPVEEELTKVPVQLKNNIFTRPLNMVTEMYSLPSYTGLDPNPLMAPFFILFYGIMMADMGYGLVMVLASAFVLYRLRPKKGMYEFAALMLMCGVSTFIMGAITGGFFGDALTHIAKMLDPNTTFTGLPALFTPLDDTLMILIGAMALGCVQIVTGMAISFIKKVKDGKLMEGLMEEIAWYAVFACIAGFAITSNAAFGYAIGAIIVLTQGYGKKGIGGKLLGIVGSIYNHVTGYFGDVLSYARLMALMLAGSVIAQVFNTLAAIPGNIFIFLVISFAGNTLNFGLNLLGCYVHDLRLQCLEYFGKFYEDGGVPFRPLEMDTKYVDIKES